MNKHLFFGIVFTFSGIISGFAGGGEPYADRKDTTIPDLQIIELVSKPGNLTARFSDVFSGIALIHIYDQSNHRILSHENYNSEGMNEWQINTSILSSGTYICEVVCNGSIERRGFVIE
jgi:hypothetical protein